MHERIFKGILSTTAMDDKVQDNFMLKNDQDGFMNISFVEVPYLKQTAFALRFNLRDKYLYMHLGCDGHNTSKLMDYFS